MATTTSTSTAPTGLRLASEVSRSSFVLLVSCDQHRFWVAKAVAQLAGTLAINLNSPLDDTTGVAEIPEIKSGDIESAPYKTVCDYMHHKHLVNALKAANLPEPALAVNIEPSIALVTLMAANFFDI